MNFTGCKGTIFFRNTQEKEKSCIFFYNKKDTKICMFEKIIVPLRAEKHQKGN